MTTYEHAMVGVTAAAAAGLHLRYGWRIVAVAALAAISPDWDALTIFGSLALFDQGHRVWGHNVFVAPLVGALIGELDYRFDVTGRAGRGLGRYIKAGSRKQPIGEDASVPIQSSRAAWLIVAALAALSHLPADLVVSGTATLSDWELQLLWPFSKQGWVYPLVRWGDPGMSILFALGMLAMAQWPARVRGTAAMTLALVIAYIVLRRVVYPW